MRSLAASCVLAIVVGVVPAQDKAKPTTPPVKARPKPEAFTDPAKAGPDFLIQGEYRGPNTGAQVIADGDGTFTLRLFAGGLPGDGWDGSPTLRFKAQSRQGTVKFLGHDAEVTVTDRKMTIVKGGQSTLLERVERTSPTAGQAPPAGATVLFDGASAEKWVNGKIVEDNLLRWGTTSKAEFGDMTLHLEFRLPFMPKARGQDRGNSGVYVQGRYEVQILDSFGLDGKDNECGGIYKTGAPKVNMCFPPLSWQTYDIDFTAARWDASGKKTADATMTVRHNGVLIQDKVVLKGATAGHARPETPGLGPIYLQDHGNPVVFRNIWIVEKK